MRSTKPVNHVKLVLVSLSIVSLLVGSFTFYSSNIDDAQAADLNNFNAGSIISDSVFYNYKTMSANDIQEFLEKKVPNCASGYTCLKDYSSLSTEKSPDAYCSGYTASTQTSSQMIYDISQSCRINPQVMLVLLQKEVGLVTHTGPGSWRYRTATGYGCPDTAACDSQYYGFFNQLYNAARQYRVYQAKPSSYNYVANRNNNIYYHPSSSCGSKTVYIQNQATAGLYNYTPYQPNTASLSAGYGTGDSCSSYGNRNFWLYFTDWFGDTQKEPEFTNFADPRRLVLINDASKINSVTSTTTGDTFPSGMVRKFTSKIELPNGNMCYRTEADHNSNSKLCMLASNLSEITINYQDLTAGNVKQINGSGYKVDIRRNIKVSENYSDTRQIQFNKTATVEGIVYYISKVDAANSSVEYGIPADMLNDSSLFEDINPTFMKVSGEMFKYNIGTMSHVDPQLAINTTRTFTSRTKIDNIWYYRTEIDGMASLGKAIPENNLSTSLAEPFSNMRCLIVNSDTQYKNISTGSASSQSAPTGTILEFGYKIITDSDKYYQTLNDYSAGVAIAIDSDALSDFSCYEPFSNPRQMRLNASSAKYNPTTGDPVGYFSKGMTREFKSKVYSNGKWYYRTASDTDNRVDLAFPASVVSNI